MAPIREGDGTPLNVKGFSEVREGDGTVLWQKNAIPDSEDLHARWDPSALTGVSDGDNVGTRPDLASTNDATGDGSYRPSGIGTEPAVEYDGVDDTHEAANFAPADEPQPTTIMLVAQWTTLPSSGFSWHHAVGVDLNHAVGVDGDTGEWIVTSGNAQTAGTADTDPHVFTVVFDGSNSDFRLDGQPLLSGSDFGSRNLANSNGDWVFGEREDFRGDLFEGYSGETMVLEGRFSDIEQQEQRLADKYGITLV